MLARRRGLSHAIRDSIAPGSPAVVSSEICCNTLAISLSLALIGNLFYISSPNCTNDQVILGSLALIRHLFHISSAICVNTQAILGPLVHSGHAFSTRTICHNTPAIFDLPAISWTIMSTVTHAA